jgi:hypothetical protein
MLRVILWSEAKDNDFIHVTFDKTKHANIWSMTFQNYVGVFLKPKWWQPPFVHSMKINPQEHHFGFVIILEWQLVVAIM